MANSKSEDEVQQFGWVSKNDPRSHAFDNDHIMLALIRLATNMQKEQLYSSAHILHKSVSCKSTMCN